ncbi:MAG: serine/threonine-protein kinase PknK [Rubripirellula sp.]
MHDELFRDPSKETNFRWQDDKETLGDASSNDPPPWNEGDVLSGFVLQKLLGSGSSGFVYRALDEKTNRTCALKLLKHGSPDDLLRNKLGFRKMISLEHPNLLRVDRIYQLGSYIALSMEEVEGVTFAEAMRQFKKLEPGEAYARLLSLMRDYGAGLAAMHANEFLHRDIKPENLMVDSEGRGRVIDYGLVESFDLNETTRGASNFLVGTPHYFAPEVICNQIYLPAGDIFSLGIVMLDALGTLQKSSTKRQAELERSRKDQFADAERIDEAIQDLPESVPSIIRSACREMLDRQPSERPTAMRLARIGLSASQVLVWQHEEPLVGRDQERAEMLAWADDVFAGDVGRLHLTGCSGIGKTRLLDELVAYIEDKNWGQLFRAKCRVREDQPLQAFDQICDALTSRYMERDRERLELDPVSVELLHGVFPVLENVLDCSMQLTPAGTTTERLDALEAAARLTEQLRLVGPLFLVIDDSQWADRDSLNVLDRLQSAVGSEGLGIITVSRNAKDPQRTPATRTVALTELGIEDSIRVVMRAAERWMIELSPITARDLAISTDGSPFRLRQLVDEFRPGGAIAEWAGSDVTEFPSIDLLWKERAERLSDDAKSVLTYVVTSGGRVSTKQLGELTGLDDSVDAPISELAQRRLIIDEATGGDCITIYHDRVADEFVKTLSGEAKRKAHHAWASLLVRQDNPERLAARIAGHFFAAREPGRAVSHAILAAEDSERLVAMTEAGRWYGRVIDYVEGQEKITQLRNASRCYREADFPVQAAEYYQQLAKLVDPQESVECQLTAATLLLRSGRFTHVRDQLQELAQTLGLPRPKSAEMGRLMVVLNGIRHSLFGKKPMVTIAAAQKEAEARGDKDDFSEVEPETGTWVEQQRLRLCLSLVRPMSIFDNLYSAELNLAGCRLAMKQGTLVQRVHVAVGEAVFGCYDRGRKRLEAQANLVRMEPYVSKLKSDRASGDMWAGIAYSHALSCRWNQVTPPVQTAVTHYQNVSDSQGFEIAHTRWLDSWANWNLGRWTKMVSAADESVDDALRRNDLFQLVMATGGLSRGAWLVRDLVGEVDRIHSRALNFDLETKEVQLFHVFEWLASLQEMIYQGQYVEASERYQSLESELRKMPYSRLQMIRVIHRSIGTLIALHNLVATPSERLIARVQLFTHQLRQEQIDYARVLADLYEGLLQHQIARFRKSDQALQRSRPLLESARDLAREQQLRPYQLAAEDALAEIHTGHSLSLLADRMRKHRVVDPTRLMRLYTIVAEAGPAETAEAGPSETAEAGPSETDEAGPAETDEAGTE